MAPKGKQGTKGQKQIHEENVATLSFYIYIIGAVMAWYFGVQYLFFWSSVQTKDWVMVTICGLIYLAMYHFMRYMAIPTFDVNGSLLDGGTDLNMGSGGMAEHVKDILLLTALVQALSLFSRYFWLLLLVAPGYGIYLLWVNFLGPWFFAPAPEEDTKAAKKRERKMERKTVRGRH